MKGKGKAIAIRPVVDIMKRHLPKVVRAIGVRTTSQDSLRLFEGAGSIKMRLLRVHHHGQGTGEKSSGRLTMDEIGG